LRISAQNAESRALFPPPSPHGAHRAFSQTARFPRVGMKKSEFRALKIVNKL
jgi:hypothetical protein